MIIFGSVRFLSKKVTKPNFFFEKNRNQTETRSNRPVSVRFSFLGQKPVQTGLARFFLVLARFFSVWLGFFGLARFFFWFFVGFVSVRFGFFGFLFIKPKPNQSGRFFQKFNRFGFFGYFFSGFLGLSVFWFFCSPLTAIILSSQCCEVACKKVIFVHDIWICKASTIAYTVGSDLFPSFYCLKME